MKVLRRVLIWLYFLPSNTINAIRFTLHGIEFGSGLQTKGKIHLKVKGKVRLGSNVRINSSPSSNPIGGGERTIFQVFRGGTLTIGDNVGISNVAITAAESVSIGSHVRIGAGACIFDTDFHSLDPLQRANRRFGVAEVVNTRPVVINDYVFIGARSMILKGSTIGKNAVIGAGSVVTGAVPENQIWAGNPARFIRNL